MLSKYPGWLTAVPSLSCVLPLLFVTFFSSCLLLSHFFPVSLTIVSVLTKCFARCFLPVKTPLVSKLTIFSLPSSYLLLNVPAMLHQNEITMMRTPFETGQPSMVPMQEIQHWAH